MALADLMFSFCSWHECILDINRIDIGAAYVKWHLNCQLLVWYNTSVIPVIANEMDKVNDNENTNVIVQDNFATFVKRNCMIPVTCVYLDQITCL